MQAALKIPIDLGPRSYDIHIGPGIIDAVESWRGLPQAASAAIITNNVVGPIYAKRLQAALAPIYRDILLIELPDGEASKSWTSMSHIFDVLLGAASDRKTVLFALGGGVIGDLTGFAAACYMRGVPFVQVPTTLLAQVDSAVGGKTAINHPHGKNMIGAFHQPIRVVSDLDMLSTLPSRELAAGLAEVIKYGPIADDEFFCWIEANIDALLARDPAALTHAIRRSCEIKAAVVGSDERETGLRAILNFGHTFGHAIEAELGYGAWLHGEAVGCGMVMAASLSEQLGMIAPAYAARIRALVERAGLPIVAPAISPERYVAKMRLDKKAEAAELRFVLIDKPGHAVVRGAPDALVRKVLADCSSRT